MILMKTWNFKSGDPGGYILAADARLVPTDYVNDQIWNLHLERNEPPSLTLRTTFGLRTPSLRMFPRFIEGDTSVNDPSKFNSPPVLKRFYPNYLRVVLAIYGYRRRSNIGFQIRMPSPGAYKLQIVVYRPGKFASNGLRYFVQRRRATNGRYQKWKPLLSL